MTQIAAIVLAAGSSQRFGDRNKLLATVDGKPVLQHVLKGIEPLDLAKKIVVVKPGDDEVLSLIDRAVFDIAENHDAENGMGSSIAVGIAACGNVDAALLILGDMPFVQQATCLQLLAALDDHPDMTVIAPTCEGRRGHPVLFRRQHFADLRALNTDSGAKPILTSNESTFLAVPTNDPGILADIDVPADAVS